MFHPCRHQETNKIHNYLEHCLKIFEIKIRCFLPLRWIRYGWHDRVLLLRPRNKGNADWGGVFWVVMIFWLVKTKITTIKTTIPDRESLQNEARKGGCRDSTSLRNDNVGEEIILRLLSGRNLNLLHLWKTEILTSQIHRTSFLHPFRVQISSQPISSHSYSPLPLLNIHDVI